jgi:tetratricopeptide (TPR) repeat protein
MRTFDDSSPVRSSLHRGWTLVAALVVSACAGSRAARPPALEVHDGSGFTLTERVRVGADVRSDFEGAVRLLEQERYAEGVAVLQRVVEDAPQATAPHIDLAIAYGRMGELEPAEASLRRALELNPRHPAAHNELGIVLRRMGRFAEARASYEKALELHPGFHFARRNLAILCDVYLADRACALEHYELYARAVPDDEAAALWAADLRNRVGR